MPMVVVSNGGGTKRKIRDIRIRVNNPEAMWPKVGRVVAQQTRKQFTSKGSYFGTPWRPLTPAYRAWKISHGYSRSILVQTGEMRASFTNLPMDVMEMHGNRAKFGSRNQKAVWHHHGTHYHGKQVNPPRPILFNNPVLEEAVVTKVREYIFGRESI